MAKQNTKQTTENPFEKPSAEARKACKTCDVEPYGQLVRFYVIAKHRGTLDPTWSIAGLHRKLQTEHGYPHSEGVLRSAINKNRERILVEAGEIEGGAS